MAEFTPSENNQSLKLADLLMNERKIQEKYDQALKVSRQNTDNSSSDLSKRYKSQTFSYDDANLNVTKIISENDE